MKNLPVGQQDFEKLIRKDCVYVDKTAYIHQMMLSGGDTFFLSRPRRFGKSLLLGTFKAIFEGKKELFKNLNIEDKINWEPHPVIVIDMSKDAGSVETLKLGLANFLKTIAEFHQVDVNYHEESPSTMLERLISMPYLKTGKQVVVLVDEYDKPVLDQIDDLDLANAMREVLYTFYGALKSSATYLKLLVVTGITKISQTSIFSGFNNLNDLSYDSPYAAICGYTQEELESNFAGYIHKTAQNNQISNEELLALVKSWYNGYSWDAKTFLCIIRIRYCC
ncbi:Predicted AAA-ATPase [bacterium A37T11]|nr:Predicted AAA-ATPase [bacterium A37T11]